MNTTLEGIYNEKNSPRRVNFDDIFCPPLRGNSSELRINKLGLIAVIKMLLV